MICDKVKDFTILRLELVNKSCELRRIPILPPPVSELFNADAFALCALVCYIQYISLFGWPKNIFDDEGTSDHLCNNSVVVMGWTELSSNVIFP